MAHKNLPREQVHATLVAQMQAIQELLTGALVTEAKKTRKDLEWPDVNRIAHAGQHLTIVAQMLGIKPEVLMGKVQAAKVTKVEVPADKKEAFDPWFHDVLATINTTLGLDYVDKATVETFFPIFEKGISAEDAVYQAMADECGL